MSAYDSLQREKQMKSHEWWSIRFREPWWWATARADSIYPMRRPNVTFYAKRPKGRLKEERCKSPLMSKLRSRGRNSCKSAAINWPVIGSLHLLRLKAHPQRYELGANNVDSSAAS